MLLWNAVVDPGPLGPADIDTGPENVAYLSKSEGKRMAGERFQNGFKSDYGNILNTRRTFITVL